MLICFANFSFLMSRTSWVILSVKISPQRTLFHDLLQCMVCAFSASKWILFVKTVNKQAKQKDLKQMYTVVYPYRCAKRSQCEHKNSCEEGNVEISFKGKSLSKITFCLNKWCTCFLEKAQFICFAYVEVKP